MLKISKATHQKRQKYPPPPIGYSIRFITFAANIVTMGNWGKKRNHPPASILNLRNCASSITSAIRLANASDTGILYHTPAAP